LTGQWEKRLKEIERGAYSPKPFIHDMKKMVDDLVTEVRMEKNVKRFTASANSYPGANGKKKGTKKARSKKQGKASQNKLSMQCPKCKKGTVVKGKTRYGCNQFGQGCAFAVPFEFMGKKISDNQVKRLIDKGSTVKLKGFKTENGKVDGFIMINEQQQLTFKPTESPKASKGEMPSCPSCKKGKLVKGKTAYGCSMWKSGCDFRYGFADIKSKAKGKKLTRELVLKIIAGQKTA